MRTKPTLAGYAARATPVQPTEQHEHHRGHHHLGITATSA
jgi:hypothetical protein